MILSVYKYKQLNICLGASKKSRFDTYKFDTYKSKA